MSRLRHPFQRRPPAAIEPLVFRRLHADPRRRPWYFVSLRWQAIIPLALVVLVTGMAGAYLVADAITAAAEQRDIERVLTASSAVASRMSTISAAQQREVTRIAYTEGVAAGIQTRKVMALHPLLEPLAAAADLDYLIVTDNSGVEIVGLQRVVTASGAIDYAVASGTDLTALLDTAPARGGVGISTRATFARTGQDHALLTAGPVVVEDRAVGMVLAGIQAGTLVERLQGGDGAGIALFGVDGEFVRTTLPFDDATRAALVLSSETYTQALSSPSELPVTHLAIGSRPYRAAYIPLVAGGTPLGVVGVYLPDETFYAAVTSRETIGLLSAALVGLVITLTFTVTGRFSRRIERVTRTAHALAAGDLQARTAMRPRDEIGELGASLDRLATHAQHRTDKLQAALRRQRADSARLVAILEAIPNGIVVQDLDGRVLLINDAARELLGGQRVFRAARLHELTAVVTEKLGPALAPGIYALGDPTQVPLEGKMLQAQAAAIVLKSGKRIGTVIVLRDITSDVMREQARDKLLNELSQEIGARANPQATESLSALAREFVRNTRAIQRVIADLRDLSTFEPRDLETGQRVLPVNELVWNIAAEWEPLARAAKSRLHVSFGPRGKHVLGDDRRLRWAIGNLVDNAVKYSPPGTLITLTTRIAAPAPEQIEIEVADQGYGMSPADLRNAFTRFYRGTPCDANGNPVRKPGTGQGLYIARRVIEAHGGTVQVASRIGTGTTVVVRLPLTAPVTLELPDQHDEPRPGTDDTAPQLSSGAYDTVPLEPRRFPWERD